MSGHNNPVNLPLWESKYICAMPAKIDVVVSLGTGLQKDPSSFPVPQYRNIFADGFIARCYRTFRKLVDSEETWKKLINGLDEESQKNYFRLNIPLPGSMAIDDVSRLEEMRESVHQPRIIGECERVVNALAVTSFYFELKRPPRFSRGRFTCQGLIRSRLSGVAMAALLERTHPSGLTFVTATRTLGPYERGHDHCPNCNRFSKSVEFSIQDLAESVSIMVRGFHGGARNISGLPQSMQWFVIQQGLNDVFGPADVIKPPSCTLCRPQMTPRPLKRKLPYVNGTYPSKRLQRQRIASGEIS